MYLIVHEWGQGRDVWLYLWRGAFRLLTLRLGIFNLGCFGALLRNVSHWQELKDSVCNKGKVSRRSGHLGDRLSLGRSDARWGDRGVGSRLAVHPSFHLLGEALFCSSCASKLITIGIVMKAGISMSSCFGGWFSGLFCFVLFCFMRLLCCGQLLLLMN